MKLMLTLTLTGMTGGFGEKKIGARQFLLLHLHIDLLYFMLEEKNSDTQFTFELSL
jgi:hypothetical protein